MSQGMPVNTETQLRSQKAYRTLRRLLGQCALLALACSKLAAPALASDERDSLVGLERVLIHVSPRFDADPLPASVSAEALQTLVELRLRESGLRVEQLQVPAAPNSPGSTATGTLLLRVWVLGPSAGSYVWSVELVLLQAGSLLRKPDTGLVVGTWNYFALGSASSREVFDMLRQTVVTASEAFANDYLAANPPQRR